MPQEPDAVSALLPKTEAALESFGARPHWAKLFTMTPERIAAVHPRMEDFRQLMERFDPEGRFRNEYLDAIL